MYGSFLKFLAFSKTSISKLEVVSKSHYNMSKFKLAFLIRCNYLVLITCPVPVRSVKEECFLDHPVYDNHKSLLSDISHTSILMLML